MNWIRRNGYFVGFAIFAFCVTIALTGCGILPSEPDFSKSQGECPRTPKIQVTTKLQSQPVLGEFQIEICEK